MAIPFLQDPKQRRFGSYAFAAFAPLGAFYFAVVPFGLMNAFIVSGALGILGIFFAHKASVNPYTHIKEDGQQYLVTLDSLGSLFFYPIFLQQRPTLIHSNVGGQPYHGMYDRKDFFTAYFPDKKIIGYEQGETLTLEIPKKDVLDSSFRMERTPILFFSRKMWGLLPKTWFQEKEDSAYIESLLTYANHSFDRIGDHMEAYTTTAIKVLLKKFDVAKNPLIIIIIIVIAVAVFWFMGGNNLVQSIMGGASHAIPYVTPPAEASVPLGR